MSWVRVETHATVTSPDGIKHTDVTVCWHQWERPVDQVLAYWRAHRSGTWDGETHIARPGPTEAGRWRLERVEYATFHATRDYQPPERLF